MGIISQLIYAYAPAKVKEAIKIDELKKQNALLAKINKKKK